MVIKGTEGFTAYITRNTQRWGADRDLTPTITSQDLWELTPMARLCLMKTHFPSDSPHIYHISLISLRCPRNIFKPGKNFKCVNALRAYLLLEELLGPILQKSTKYLVSLISVTFQMCVIIRMKRTYFIWLKAFLIENILWWNQVFMMTLKI